jgi:hypothetical protein
VETTLYFREQVLRKRAYLKLEWCISIIQNPVQQEVQSDGRIRFWGFVDELPGKAIRVVTLEDGETIHNAFPDSGFKRRQP